MLATREEGFTLIEFIVAGVVAAIIVASLFGAFTGIEQLNKQTNDYTTATAAAEQLIEQYRNLPYSSIPVGTTDVTSTALASDSNLASPRDAKVVVTQVNPNGIKQVDVTVGWTSLDGYKQVQLTTQISYEGLNH